ncbi:unnamed protein product [Cunninghamella blakesleeana]
MMENYTDKYKLIRKAAKSLGITKKIWKQLMRIMAAILHIGIIQFNPDPHVISSSSASAQPGQRHHHQMEPAAQIKNVNTLEIAADLLGVDPTGLENVLKYKTQLIRNDLTTIVLNIQQAYQQRDLLCQTLYRQIIAFLIQSMNKKLDNSQQLLNVMNIVDFPGLESPSSSSSSSSVLGATTISENNIDSFDRFCITFANEHLHDLMLKQLFEQNNNNSSHQDISTILQNGNLPHWYSPSMNIFKHPNFSQTWKDIQPSTNDPHQKLSQCLQSTIQSFTQTKQNNKNSKSNNNKLMASQYQLKQSTNTGYHHQDTLFRLQSYTGLLSNYYSTAEITSRLTTQCYSDLASLFSPSHCTFDLVTQLFYSPSSSDSNNNSSNNENEKLSSLQPPPSYSTTITPSYPENQRDPCTTILTSLSDLAKQSNLWWTLCLKPNDFLLPNSCDTKTLTNQLKQWYTLELVNQLKQPSFTNITLDDFLLRYLPVLEYVQEKKHMKEHSDDDFSDDDSFNEYSDSDDDDQNDKNNNHDIDPDNPFYICYILQRNYKWNTKHFIIKEDQNMIYLSHSTWCTLESVLRNIEKREQKRNRCIAKGIPFDEMDLSYSGNPSCYEMSMDGRSITSCYDDSHCYRQHGETDSVCSNMSYTCDGTSYGGDEFSSGASNGENISGSTTPLPKRSFASKYFGWCKAPKTSFSRGCWVMMTWMTTWWLPSFILYHIGGMKRSDIRMAWREKVTLCFLILLLCAAMVWFIAFFGQLVCPHQDLFTQSELQSKTSRDNALIAIRGEIFDLTSFAPRHWASEVIPGSALFQYAGQDASDLFPVQVSALCDGISHPIPKEVTLAPHVNIMDPTAAFHDFRYFKSDYRPEWYFEKMTYLRKNYRLGFMGYDPVDILNQATNPVQIGGINTKRQWAILHDHVYDLTSYMEGGRSVQFPPGMSYSNSSQYFYDNNLNGTNMYNYNNTNNNYNSSDYYYNNNSNHNNTSTHNNNNNNNNNTSNSLDFIDNSITELFRQLAGSDITAHFDALPMDDGLRKRQLTCLRNLFFVGKVDTRNSLQCQLSEYLLLLITAFLCSVILFKFLAAFRLGQTTTEGKHDKFIICQVPCYTEGEESLRKTIDSLAVMKYDDQRKLLFLIADGMIVGSGNDRSTPQLLLDILGVDAEQQKNAQPMDFISLGEGQRQHNRGKVYSGLYTCQGHIVPYIIVVKVGTADERQKSGNRGKRDSQMILMRFLNKIHYDLPMTPLELEMHHQIKNVIGVLPSFYELVLMVDADTEVASDSLNHMVSSFVDDPKLVGLCGETVLSNEKDSWTTMIQVYEYYISHHLAKAFESLFGSVTCLPGCFCMYRVRSPIRNQPLLASHQVIHDYSENNVNTLHKKNLLHLGEDRYLTTLILKHFPTYKTKFNPNASCRTNAPDQWKILLSQRRRWINSTIHNLGELLFLPQLCGFCCFSMRFVVMLDLLSTLVMPAVVCYLGYLIYQLCTSTSQVPLMSILTLAGVYGLQAIIFISRRKWEHVGWMIVYILAIPVFSFFIPIYSFWHFDDFSWGNTRVVVGDKNNKEDHNNSDNHHNKKSKKKMEKQNVFDPSIIPLQRWSEHEAQLQWEEEEHQIMLARQQQAEQEHQDQLRKQSIYSAFTTPKFLNPFQDETNQQQHDKHDQKNHSSSLLQDIQQQLVEDQTFVYGKMPNDVMIKREINLLLDQHDLMTLTKKQVRDALSKKFGVDMTERREFINETIEQLLSEK